MLVSRKALKGATNSHSQDHKLAESVSEANAALDARRQTGNEVMRFPSSLNTSSDLRGSNATSLIDVRAQSCR